MVPSESRSLRSQVGRKRRVSFFVLFAARKPGDRLAEVIRVDRLISREHVSAVAVAAAVHQGRVRVPCASSATLGNSTERVNGDLELERRFGYRPWSRFRCRMV